MNIIIIRLFKQSISHFSFTETWLKPDNVHIVDFEGYDGSHVIRPVDEQFDCKESGGGISIFIEESLRYEVRDDLNVTLPYLEIIFIEYFFNTKLYMIGVIYRVPNTDVNAFNEKLNGIIKPIQIVMN